MTKRKYSKQYSDPIYLYDSNIYAPGGFMTQFKEGMAGMKDSFSGTNVANGLKGAAGGIMGAVGGLAGNAISGGLQSGAGNAISGIGNTIGGALSAINPALGGIVKLASGVIGGVTNKMFGSKLNEEKINDVEGSNDMLAATTVDDSSNTDILNQWSSQDFGSDFTRSDIGKDGWFSSKAKNKFKQLRREQDFARNKALSAYDNAIGNVDYMMDEGALSNFAAFGGPLHSYGADWDDGIIEVNNGGTHEENPNDGIQVGVDQQGTPNLVEEGELIWDNYVFSNRLKPNKKMKKEFKLKGKTYADNAKKVQKESEERPNDPIAKRTLDAQLEILRDMQEQTKMEKELKEQKRAFESLSTKEKLGLMNYVANLQDQQPTQIPYACGGKLNRFDNGGDKELIYKGKDLNDVQVIGVKPTKNITPYNNMSYRLPVSYLNAPDKLPGLDRVTNNVNEAATATRYNLSKENNLLPVWMRYAPALGGAVGLMTSAFKKPDYSTADAVLNAAKEAGTYKPIGYKPVGNYLTYNPFDMDYYVNKENAMASANRRSLSNLSGGNRGMAMAGLLSSDYNAMDKLGDLGIKAADYNNTQRQKVEEFNRGTNMDNSEMALKADMANQDSLLRTGSTRLSGVAQAMAMRNAIDDARSKTISGNFSRMINSLGDIGRENFGANLITTNNAYPYSIDTSKGIVGYKKQKNGGYLTIKNKRRK